jgi:hypothetical protein
VLALASGCAAIGGPAAAPPAPDPASPRPRCSTFLTLESGDEVCLLDGPRTLEDELAAMAEAMIEGVAEAPLNDVSSSEPVPARVDLRRTLLDGCIQIRNQGKCGWCSVFAAGLALDALYCAEGCPPGRVSTSDLWAAGNDETVDCTLGWNAEAALRATTRRALLPESAWPFTNGTRAAETTRPAPDAVPTSTRYRAQELRMIGREGRVESIKRVIASRRVVVATAGLCRSSGLWAAGRSRIEATRGRCGTRTTYDGYHVIAIVGYDDARREFTVANSWGESWGDAGYGRVSYDFLEADLSEAGYLVQADTALAGCTPDASTPADPAARVAALCGAIRDCRACAVTSGCMMCDGACVASEPPAGAPAPVCTRRARSASDCSAPTGACAAHGSHCAECAEDPACAFCNGRCVPWPSAALACEGRPVATELAQCNDVLGACAAASTCDRCGTLGGCGWCVRPNGGAQCVGGGATASDRLQCTRWVPAGGSCSVPRDAGMLGDGSPPAREEPLCLDEGAVCPLGTECCDGLRCVAGWCVDPATCGVPASPCASSTCCTGLSCSPAIFGGESECCVGVAGGQCATSEECCGEMTCEGGRCVDRAAGQSCASALDCYGTTLVCVGGVCTAP